MIAEAKELLKANGFKRAVIVDDAFDPAPLPGDLEQQLWDTFFDDWTEEDEARLAQEYNGLDLAEVDALELAKDPRFVASLWQARSDIAAAEPLFEEYERVQNAKRAELAPLQELLKTDLAVNCGTLGRSGTIGLADAQILFLDLYLGYVETDDAIDAAIARVKSVVDPRRDDPPVVVLLSRSPRLEELGPEVRDKAGLLGCQFRMVKKGDLGDRPGMAERLYDLVKSRPDAIKLNNFINEWDKALLSSREEFLKSIRALDLPDYANTQELALKAEEEPLGDYVLDLFDIYLHNTLEGHVELVRAAKSLNQVDLSNYPPGQFMPPEELVLMMDGTIFHNQVRTDIEAEIDADPKKVSLGDVFMAPVKKPRKGAKDSPKGGDPTAGAREVFAVLTQACDLQHGRATQLLMLTGTAMPYDADSAAKGLKTAVMRVDGVPYQVDWNLFSPQAWPLSTLKRRIRSGTRRVRRFRIHHALQLQQSFIGKLGRVGTIADLPGRHAVGVKLYLRTKAGDAKLLLHRGKSQAAAVVLSGRAKNKTLTWLLLSPALIDDFRQALTDMEAKELPSSRIGEVRGDPQFYRVLKRGIDFTRASGGKKALKEGDYSSIIEIFPSESVVVEGKAPQSVGPIIIELEWK